MKRLKQLRESANYSQKQLAEMLKTSQQTVARWETGKSEPNLAALRDLAVIFGTSVDDLLGRSAREGRAMPSTTYHLLVGEESDGFWGHIGLKLIGQPHSKWFPVTAGAMRRLRREVAELDDSASWLNFATLANKLVMFRPASIQKICFLDDACDQPSGDWELDLPYQGRPLEIYRAFERLNDCSGDWDAAAAALPTEDEQGELVGGDDRTWSRFIEQLRPQFNGEASDAFLSTAAEAFIEESLFEEDEFYRKTHYTSFYFVDGEVESFWVEDEDLVSFLADAELGIPPSMINFTHFGGDNDSWYPAQRFSAIVMPLIDVTDAMQGQDDSD
jgi:transcriptional regulator with XRE-family HTH domain